MLDLSSMRLNSFPLETWVLTGLRQLSVADNNISVVPPDLALL